MKVTFKDGTVIDNVTAQELPFVLAMSNPSAVADKINEQLAAAASPLSWVSTDKLHKLILDLFR